MAGTIKTTIALEHSHGNLALNVASKSISRTQTAQRARMFTQVIGTGGENIDFTDIGTPEEVYILNLDSTNYVTIGMSDGGTQKTLIRLKAGKQLVMPLEPSITVKATADTAAVPLLIAAYDA